MQETLLKNGRQYRSHPVLYTVLYCRNINKDWLSCLVRFPRLDKGKVPRDSLLHDVVTTVERSFFSGLGIQASIQIMQKLDTGLNSCLYGNVKCPYFGHLFDFVTFFHCQKFFWAIRHQFWSSPKIMGWKAVSMERLKKQHSQKIKINHVRIDRKNWLSFRWLPKKGHLTTQSL
jgi:hypothetical protein